MNKAEAIKKIEAAIKAVQAAQDTGPGRWEVEDAQDGVVAMSYLLEVVEEGAPAPHPELYRNEDAIWKKWGGDKILQIAGVEAKKAGSDGYTDKYGDEIYCEYVTIECKSEEEESED